jgi:hypothetical protein
MCMIMSLLMSPGGAPETVPRKIGGSPVYLHATGTIPDPDKLAPYWREETRVLAELHAEAS